MKVTEGQSTGVLRSSKSHLSAHKTWKFCTSAAYDYKKWIKICASSQYRRKELLGLKQKNRKLSTVKIKSYFMKLYELHISPQTKSHYTITIILKSNYLIWQLCCRDLRLWCPILTGRLNSGIIVVYPSDAAKNAWLPWCGPRGLQG